MTSNKCVVFSGNANPRLARDVASPKSGIKHGEIYLHQFASGESYCQIKENIRGADVFLLQSIIRPANDNLMQLLIMADAARRASAERITAVIPYMGYSRQDRKDKSRVPISAKLVMDIIAASGINRVVTMDLHAPQIAGFTNLPFDHLHFRPVLIEAMAKNHIEVVVAPDIGAVKKAEEFSRRMGIDLGFISKKRKDDVTVETTQFIGDVENRNVLLIDDLTESAGTLVEAAKVCQTNGARQIFAAVTHNCLSDLGIQRLTDARKDGLIKEFYASNSTDSELGLGKGGVTTLSVDELFSKAIQGIHNNSSISALFD